MPPSYIIGFDDSAAAWAALRFARRLAGGTGAKIVAAYVYADTQPVPSPFGPVTLITQNADLTAVAREAALRVVEHLPDDVEGFAIAGASVPHELGRLARREHVALLAVGATHRGSVGRVLPGSIGERVIHDSSCPVLVVPDDHAGRRVRRIAVAYDGKEQSRRALRAAATLAQRLGASLVLIAACQLEGEHLLHPTEHQDDLELMKSTRAVLERAASRLLAQGLDVSIRVRIGVPGPVIAQAGADEDVDLLVAGSRGRGAIRGALAGSVSRHLVDHAPCAVLVVPRHASIELVAAEETGPVGNAASS